MTDIQEAMEYYKRKRDKEFESKMLPCPFCGGKGKIRDFGYVNVRCEKCGAVSNNYVGCADAVQHWNQRVADSRIAQLHSEIYHMKNRIAELDEELAIKQSIINRQVAIMGEMEHEAEHG